MSRRVAKLSPTVVLMATAKGRSEADGIASLSCPGERSPLERMWPLSVGYLFHYNFMKLEEADMENILEALR